MSKVIDDEVFEEALDNIDNRLIMEKAVSSFRKVIESDELYRCKLIALWEALQKWNPEGRKFTSFLYQKVQWECLKVMQQQRKSRCFPIIMDEAFYPNNDFQELIEPLPDDMQDILTKRYVYRMTLREISEDYGSCHETVRRKIKRALRILKNHQKQ